MMFKNLVNSQRVFLHNFYDFGLTDDIPSIRDVSIPSFNDIVGLSPGDHLVVFDSYFKIIWHGNISKQHLSPHTRSNNWNVMFLKSSRALYSPVKTSRKNIFHYDNLNDFLKELSKIENDDKLELYRHALSPWLLFDNNRDWYSLAQHEWLLTYREICSILFNPTPSEVFHYKSYFREGATLIPYSEAIMIKLFYLFKIRREIAWNHYSVFQTNKWFHKPSLELNNLTPLEILQSDDFSAIEKLYLNLKARYDIQRISFSKNGILV